MNRELRRWHITTPIIFCLSIILVLLEAYEQEFLLICAALPLVTSVVFLIEKFGKNRLEVLLVCGLFNMLLAMSLKAIESAGIAGVLAAFASCALIGYVAWLKYSSADQQHLKSDREE